MKVLTHITAGRTAIKALLVAAVVTAGIAGAVGTAAAEPMDGKGDDPYPDGLYLSLDGKGNDPFPPRLYESLDGKGNDVYPPPGVYASRVATGVIDGKGSDAVTYAFPINNFTLSVDSSTAALAQLGEEVSPVARVGCGGGSGKADFYWTRPDASVSLVVSQDMDPY